MPALILRTRQRTSACDGWWLAHRWVWAAKQRWFVLSLLKSLEALEESFLLQSKMFHRFTWSCLYQLLVLLLPLTFNFPPLSSSLIFSRASTVLFRSLCSRLPKSLNMVEPPESTTFCVTTQNNYCYVLRVHVSNRSRQVCVYLVERTPDVDGTVLDDFIHHFWDGLGEVWVGKLDENKKVKLKKIIYIYIYKN